MADNDPNDTLDDSLFDLPEIPSDYREPILPDPSWEQQMAHAHMLIAWRKAQGLEVEHPPRNLEPFVL